MVKPRVGVFKLASCDGCQLQVLSLEDQLLAWTDRLDLVVFAEASSRPDDGEPLDVALVEGSVSTPEQREALASIRARARTLVAIGACSTAGGIQALRNVGDADAFARRVYPEPGFLDTLAMSTPLSAHVRVDLELPGCPIAKEQLVIALEALSRGRRPSLRNESVCMECKRSGATCVLVAAGEPCLGPVTRAGCGALCPSFGRGCYGCFGPKERAATAALSRRLRADGMEEEERRRRYRLFTGWADAFRQEAARVSDD